ncbi:hypothetical protein CDD82_4768 [Ophiocordyceps australis]|uniref:Small ribosomal subunit protein uS5m n=1 Tax=Ophiocordyceps australis TaxID=1399860 RepID=A0A2C5Z6J0_9HYPO|nr:hypothetical protein CDD82_4768 [Ophiocordyceps australis]
MNASRPAVQTLLLGRRCLPSTKSLAKSTVAPPQPCPVATCARRFFQTTPAVRGKRKSRFRNVKAADLGLLRPKRRAAYIKQKFPDYTAADFEELSKKYSPEQLEAIRAGEAAIDPDDLIFQGRLRDDPYRPDYIEDYSVLDPRYDIRANEIDGDDNNVKPDLPKWQQFDEWIDDYGARMTKLMEKKTDQQILRAMIRALHRVKDSHGVDLIDLTPDELQDLEQDPELLIKYVQKKDGQTRSKMRRGSTPHGDSSELNALVDAKKREVDAYKRRKAEERKMLLAGEAAEGEEALEKPVAAMGIDPQADGSQAEEHSQAEPDGSLAEELSQAEPDGSANEARGSSTSNDTMASATTETDARQEIERLQESIKEIDQAVDAEFAKEMEKVLDESDRVIMPSNLELLEHGPGGRSQLDSVEMPDLGKVPGVEGLYNKSDEEKDITQSYKQLRQLTDMDIKDLKSLYTKSIVTRYVSNQTRLGKVESASVVAIAGNGNGLLGLGIAKSTDIGVAIETAKMLAIRNMKPIPRYENRTIFGNVKVKISGTIVEMFTRPPGFGLRCPERIFEMCRAAGLHDMSVRIPRSRNAMNSVKAAYQALLKQPDPEEIALGRGRKLVDVRKVYYGGSVH